MRTAVAPHEALERRIRSYGERALVAFSGGVDSSLVLALAARALGPDSVTAVTAVSPSYPAGELELAAAVASDLSVAHRTVRTHEVERETYARNDEMRCYHCKAELYATLGRIVSASADGDVVLAGANADDQDDFRPGLWAGDRAGIRNPLLEERVGKSMVRQIARDLGLRVADKPALACLSSRVTPGIRITPELLGQIDAAEREIRALGFDVVRVRHRDGLASVEVERDEIDRLTGHPGFARALGAIRSLGWSRVEVDPDGYRPAGASSPPRRAHEGRRGARVERMADEGTIGVKELGHIVLYVRNLARSVAFYRDVLGWRQVVGEGSIGFPAAMFSGGRTHHELLLIEVGENAVPIPTGRRIGLYHFGLKVGDTDEELREMLSRLVNAGVPVNGATDHGMTHSLYIADPDGNEIELYIDVPGVDWNDPDVLLSRPKALRL